MPKIYAPWTDDDWEIMVNSDLEHSIDALTMIRDDRGDADRIATLHGQRFSPIFLAFIGVEQEEVIDSFRGTNVHPHEMTDEDKDIWMTGQVGDLIYWLRVHDVTEQIGPVELKGVNYRCLHTSGAPVRTRHNYMATFGLSCDEAHKIVMS